MNIHMCGLDWNRAPIKLRERLSFTKKQVTELDRTLRAAEGVEGAVLLSTCNRTEVYLSCCESFQPDPSNLLCSAAGADCTAFSPYFVSRSGCDAARHLMELAGGLHSQIWGEDQIVTQVKQAAALAREAGTTDPVLETLFRGAVTAGKAIKTKIRLSGVSISAAHRAVAVLERDSAPLAGKRALVIGNGEIGRLCAALLHAAGCAVTVTLRTYRHGETVVPAGCATVPYEARYTAMDGADLLISATTSPHYTVTVPQLSALKHPPRQMVDLAIPRDIQPEAGDLPDVRLYNMDDLGAAADRTVPPQAVQIVDKYLDQLYQWDNYRTCLPALEQVKQAISRRILSSSPEAWENRELVELSVSRAVDLLSGGLKGHWTPEELVRCAEKIELHTTAQHGAGRCDDLEVP